MDALTMVVLIVLISCGTGILSGYLGLKKKQLKNDPELRKRVERLENIVGDGSIEDRVRALETIVTDEKRRLDREIKNL
ncbi:MAG: hypothetical protein OXG25_02765 [Gammaproteobacteria bacterium]|nr:hypothetical protein [Gammaproteobacteria bacterium]